MPLPSTIMWTVLHLLLALGLNYVAKELGLIKYSELITVYFIILAARYFDAQTKFSIAYREDPDTVEAILREQLQRQEQE